MTGGDLSQDNTWNFTVMFTYKERMMQHLADGPYVTELGFPNARPGDYILVWYCQEIREIKI
jgi:hypothetical protein